MALTHSDLSAHLSRIESWPTWVTQASYDPAMHPQAPEATTPEAGANCQLYAYAFVALLGRGVPPHRSSELWEEPALVHVAIDDAANLDLVLFNRTTDPWGAHVAVVVGNRLLHLAQEVGSPALWEWRQFADRERYREIVGIVRPAHI